MIIDTTDPYSEIRGMITQSLTPDLLTNTADNWIFSIYITTNNS